MDDLVDVTPIKSKVIRRVKDKVLKSCSYCKEDYVESPKVEKNRKEKLSMTRVSLPEEK